MRAIGCYTEKPQRDRAAGPSLTPSLHLGVAGCSMWAHERMGRWLDDGHTGWKAKAAVALCSCTGRYAAGRIPKAMKAAHQSSAPTPHRTGSFAFHADHTVPSHVPPVARSGGPRPSPLPPRPTVRSGAAR